MIENLAIVEDALTPASCAAALRVARAREQEAAVDQLVLAAAYAELHPAARTARGDSGSHLFGERVVDLAGPGAPRVAEFAAAELAAELDLPEHVAIHLMGDALELKHRLPRLWAHLRRHSGQGPISVGKARVASGATRSLTPEQAEWVDRMVTSRPSRFSVHRAEALAVEAVLREDPDRAAAWEEEALAHHQGVWLHQEDRVLATTRVEMLLDTIDARRFDETVGDLATELGRLGDRRMRDTRRAAAVGVLADPQHALRLLTAAGEEPDPGGAAPRRRRPRALLHLHLDAASLLEPEGSFTALNEQARRVTGDLLADWLARTDVTVVPVLGAAPTAPRIGRLVHLGHADPADAVDVHDPPEWMREHVVLRDGACVFPACSRDARGCDLDHIESYLSPDQGGPPGQTHPANLAPLCRRHHRMKTHLGWDYRRRRDGTYAWTAPDGRGFTVLPVPRRC